MKYVLRIEDNFIMKGSREAVYEAIDDYIEEYGEADDVQIIEEEEYHREVRRMKALGMI